VDPTYNGNRGGKRGNSGSLAAAQCAAEWVQKFALILTFLTLQEKEAEKESMISNITDEMRQSSIKLISII
jgi:hypothetical protein